MPRIASFGAMSALSLGFNRISLGGPYFMASFNLNSDLGFVDKLANGNMVVAGYTPGGNTSLVMTLDKAGNVLSSFQPNQTGTATFSASVFAKTSDDIMVMAGNTGAMAIVSADGSGQYGRASTLNMITGDNHAGYCEPATGRFYFGGFVSNCCGNFPLFFATRGNAFPPNSFDAGQSSDQMYGSMIMPFAGCPRSGYVSLAYTALNTNIALKTVSVGAGGFNDGGSTELANGATSGSSYNVPYRLLYNSSNQTLKIIGMISDNGTPSAWVQNLTWNSTTNHWYAGTGSWGLEFYHASGATSTLRFKNGAFDSLGNLYCVGDTYGGGNMALIVKIDPSGNVLWQRTITFNGLGASGTVQLKGVSTDGSGDLWVCGAVHEYVTNNNYGVLLKLPADGSKTGTYTLPTTNDASMSVVYSATLNAPTVKAPYNLSVTTNNSFGMSTAGSSSLNTYTPSKTSVTMTENKVSL